MTHYCPTCDRYLIRYGSKYRCFYCLGRQNVDPEAVGEWPSSVIEGMTR
jgi:hypothetical protein